MGVAARVSLERQRLGETDGGFFDRIDKIFRIVLGRGFADGEEGTGGHAWERIFRDTRVSW
jgi:hypothetical protein